MRSSGGTFSRDPLSVRFDAQAKLTVTLAIEQASKHRAALARKAKHIPVPHIRVRVPNPPGVVPDRTGRHAGKDSLSEYERAFLRALYYDDRIHQLTSRDKPDARWSLKAGWGTVPVLPGQARYLTITLFPDTEGARYAKKHPAVSYAENPELRSLGGAEPGTNRG